MDSIEPPTPLIGTAHQRGAFFNPAPGGVTGAGKPRPMSISEQLDRLAQRQLQTAPKTPPARRLILAVAVVLAVEQAFLGILVQDEAPGLRVALRVLGQDSPHPVPFLGPGLGTANVFGPVPGFGYQ